MIVAPQTGQITPVYYQQVQSVAAGMHPGEDWTPLLQAQQWSLENTSNQIASQYPNLKLNSFGGYQQNVQGSPFQPNYGQPVGPQFANTPEAGATANVMITSGPQAGQVIQNVPMALAQYIATQNLGHVIAPAGGGGGTANPQINIPNGGRIRPTAPAPSGETTPPPAAAPAPPNVGPGPSPSLAPPAPPTLGMTLAPGTTEAMTGSASDYNQTRTTTAGAQGRIFTAQQALQALQAAPTGPGTDFVSAVNGILGSYPQIAPQFLQGITGQAQAYATNRDEAQKYMTQLSMGMASSMGQGTDEKLAVAIQGTPNIHIQNLAAQNVLKVQIELERMQQMMWQEAQAQGITPANFANWKANWTTNHDPRAFIADQMPLAQRKKLFDELNAPGHDREVLNFVQTADEAYAAGYIPQILNMAQ